MTMDLFSIHPDNWPKRHLTDEDFGVPPEFICDGCTASPDWSWSNPCCKFHDMEYFLGAPENMEEFMKAKAIKDKKFLWTLLHNANYDAYNPTERVGKWTRLKRKTTAYMMYYTGVSIMTKAVTSLRSREDGELPRYPDPKFIETAIKARKWRVIENEESDSRTTNDSDSH